jgi:TPR repeat protein
MRKVKVLFFAADPLAVLPNGRTAALQLGQDVREVQQRVAAAKRASVLEFDWRPAARTDDLVQALRETRPAVVHFSGHGRNDGLVLTASGGQGARLVDADALTRIFEVFPNRVRLVVLSACYSRAQAEAIRREVDCAIGTPGQIMDEVAIQFNAAFYGAVASGESVQAAFDQASAEVDLAPPRGTRPELICRDGVDPSRVFLVPRFRRLKRIAATAALVLLSAALIASWPPPPPPPPTHPPGVQLGDCESPGTRSVPAEPSPGAGVATSSASSGSLEEAKALCAAGNYEDAVRLLREAAHAGNPEAMGLVGIADLSGEGTHPEPELGVELLREAADKGDLRSMNMLATLYEIGYGVKVRSRHWAKHWLRRAATEAGDAEAMRKLGVIYREARSDSALYWLSEAVAAGSSDAGVDLGFMNAHGVIVPRDTAEAIRLYRSAAAGGSARGMFALGRAFQTGFGVRQDQARAHDWYLRAACAGSADAMNEIGAQYLQGLGVPADRDEAIRWFRLAEAAGSQVAVGNLHALKAPERVRRWQGPVASVLAWLGLSGSPQLLACASPPAQPRAVETAEVAAADTRNEGGDAQPSSPSSSRVISIMVRRKPARAKRRWADSFRSAVESTTRGAPLARSSASVASSSIRPTPRPRSAGSTTMS